MSPRNNIKFSIDRGGTFTDIYAEFPHKPGFKILKLLSNDPDNYDDAPSEGIRRVIQEIQESAHADNIDLTAIAGIRMGTTVATNALLERNGAKCALLITKGFKDLLNIGSQARPKLFDLRITKPKTLYDDVIEVEERIRPYRAGDHNMPVIKALSGEKFSILKALRPKELYPKLEKLIQKDIKSIAIVFMHSYEYPEHELKAAQIARELGFENISLSSQIMPTVKIVGRGDTTTVDAYLNPHIKNYLKQFRHNFVGNNLDDKLLLMRSDGGLTRANGFTGSKSILSGPAGGVVGYALTTYKTNNNKAVIGFDMGGTSTDVSRFDGEYEISFESEISGVRLQTPQLHIKTVAAGGGSRLFFKNGMLVVGPESAGAHPGPVSYRKDGYLSITDANLVLGRLQPDFFPKIFGPNKNLPLDQKAALEKMQKLTDTINNSYQNSRAKLSTEEVALGFLRVANEVMSRPIREISIMRGHDIKDHTLATFGGAGPQHACALAQTLGIKKIFIHKFAGILSAYGMGLADIVNEEQQPCSIIYNDKNLLEINSKLDLLINKSEGKLLSQAGTDANIISVKYLNMRYQGTNTSLMIQEPTDKNYKRAFLETYQREFGFKISNHNIIINDLRVKSRAITEHKARQTPPPISITQAKPINCKPCYFADNKGKTSWISTNIYEMAQLSPGNIIQGPAIIVHDISTIVIEPNCYGQITQDGHMEITIAKEDSVHIGKEVNPIQLSVFSNLFMSIAEQMGRMLAKTAISTNIKERLDFSCAVFNKNGDLVANAPHVPIHLGSMSDAVKAQININKNNISVGDVFISNHPVAGGSHLPDITIITPVFHQEQIAFWLASRGHHADIGGISPGSMPSDSKSIFEEGAAIKSAKIIKHGVFQEEKITNLLRNPANSIGTRAIKDNISDLKAQIAANQKGASLLNEMIDKYNLEIVQAYMEHLQDAAEKSVRENLKRLKSLNSEHIKATDYLDDGSKIQLKLTINQETGNAIFDFSGTDAELSGNCNAPKSITKSAILYSLRCLIDDDLPLNSGCLKPATIIIPQGSLLDPSPNAAVVGGNVQTSQRIVDVILKAFGLAAASQGCMNNFTFGNENISYYETIGGGAGAGPDWHGQSGVHTHMTNTRITDPEILERRFPVQLNEFSLRKNSGGSGQFRGGNGLIREIEFLQPLDISILSERRVLAPYGLAGGNPGQRGKNTLTKKDGRKINLGSKNSTSVEKGDILRIETPGGGGYGLVTNRIYSDTHEE